MTPILVGLATAFAWSALLVSLFGLLLVSVYTLILATGWEVKP